MLKIAGLALLGLAALMVIPSGVPADAAPVMYGAASVELVDADGNVKMSQAVHNRVTDEGEAYLIDQVFDTGDAADSFGMTSICLVSDSHSGYTESMVAQDQQDNQPSINVGSVDSNDPADWVSSFQVCRGSGFDDSAGSTAVIGPITYVADTHVGSNQAIGGFIVCNVASSLICAGQSGGVAFAAIDIADIRLQSAGDSLTITYTFDITTPDI